MGDNRISMDCAMKERGILFRDRLVRRIIDKVSPKWQTRRVIDPLLYIETESDDDANIYQSDPRFGAEAMELLRHPYGVVGDRLWVREAWRSWREICEEDDDDHEHAPHCDQTYVAYRATPRVGFRPIPDRQAITYLDESTPIDSMKPQLLGPWKPGIHLRRDWARITLEITKLRIERLQDITEEDAIAEGVELGVPLDVLVNGEAGKVEYFNARTAFAHLWCSVNGPDSWKANPWVRVVDFKLLDARGQVAPLGKEAA